MSRCAPLFPRRGNRATTTYPDGTAIGYGYTERNELGSVTAGGPPPLATYTYDLAGKRTGRMLENGVVSSSAYDNAGRLTSLTHTSGTSTVSGIGYTLNAVGNRTSRTESGAGFQPVSDACSHDDEPGAARARGMGGGAVVAGGAGGGGARTGGTRKTARQRWEKGGHRAENMGKDNHEHAMDQRPTGYEERCECQPSPAPEGSEGENPAEGTARMAHTVKI